MSHERSITIEVDGKFINIPTIVDGKQLSNEEATRLHRDGKLAPLGEPFSTLEEAVKAAGERSKKGESTEEFLFGKD